MGLGEIFLDKYRVDSILGYGGMGVVALCTHLALNERVAIKVLRRDVLDDADAVERFMREAQAASKLKSEYVARVTDVGRSGKNVPYMVMEYLEGHDLEQLLSERGSLALLWAVELTLQACEALAEAHSIGIVHRDVKPSNLFVTWRPDGSALVKVLDFGISKSASTAALQLTQTQSLLGTPAYMSPEQMRSARMVDARTDIWSLGTVLYELLEGRRPFEAESFSEMCVKVAVDSPAPMTSTPPALQQVVLRCLEKLPEQRYPSMADLGRDLIPFSRDPHQAQVLVERMSRMLRRSQVIDGDPAHSGVRTTILELHSGERKAEIPPAAGSHPEIEVPRVIQRAGSPSLTAPAETFHVSGRSRRGKLLVALSVSAAATFGVIISLARDAPKPPAKAEELIVPRAPIAPSAPVMSASPARTPPPAARPGSDSASPPDTAVAPSPLPVREPSHSAAAAPARSIKTVRDAAKREPWARPGPPPAKPPVCDPFSDAHASSPECVSATGAPRAN